MSPGSPQPRRTYKVGAVNVGAPRVRHGRRKPQVPDGRLGVGNPKILRYLGRGVGRRMTTDEAAGGVDWLYCRLAEGQRRPSRGRRDGRAIDEEREDERLHGGGSREIGARGGRRVGAICSGQPAGYLYVVWRGVRGSKLMDCLRRSDVTESGL